MKKVIITALTLTLMNFLSACQNSGQSTPAALRDRNTANGPSDGGGGDTCNGKMIESYRVDITGLEEYKDFVQPILDKLVSKDGKKSSSPFAFSPTLKNWYIIDCKLQDIPKERKGLFLETYQTAIHSSREVFIDSVSYAGMAKEEKGKLLLHEIVMGYYLTKYLSLEDMCKITNNCTPDVIMVSKWKMYRSVPYSPLNNEDHQKIRSVTAWLMAQGDALSLENFVNILASHDFDKRFNLGSGEAEETLVDPQVLVRMFKRYQWTESFPKFCQFDLATNVSKSTCKTQVTADIRDYLVGIGSIKQVYVKLTITRESDKKIFEQEFSYPLTSADQKIKLYTNQFGPVLKATPISFTAHWPGLPGNPLVEGAKSQILFLMLNFVDKENPEIYELIYNTLVWYNFEEQFATKDGVKYKETYGYSSILNSESDALFVENELPFSFRMGMTGKTLLKFEIVPNSSP